MPEQTTVTPARAAELVDVETYTIRRWCEWHAVHLSPGASPGPGALRRLTMRDVEVLRAVRDMRAQGLTTTSINEQLVNMAFPEVNGNTAIEAHQDAQEGPGTAPAPIVASDYVFSIERRFEALEQARQEDTQAVRSGIVMFALGALTMGIVFLLIVLLLYAPK